MRIAIPTEIKNNEFRVAITPAGVHDLVLLDRERQRVEPLFPLARLEPFFADEPPEREITDVQSQKYTPLFWIRLLELEALHYNICLSVNNFFIYFSNYLNI